jgi:hypothetical protein
LLVVIHRYVLSSAVGLSHIAPRVITGVCVINRVAGGIGFATSTYHWFVATIGDRHFIRNEQATGWRSSVESKNQDNDRDSEDQIGRSRSRGGVGQIKQLL